MAEKQSLRTLDTQQKIKNDHELFLEAYEKPTQIYRFLKARHSLEPIFLRRNLSYMKSRNSQKRLSKSKKINVEDLHNKAKKQTDLSLEIQSDSQLQITFHSLVKTDTSDNNNNNNMVEVLLYRFKQLSPEMLITNPTSLPCDCTILGKCLIPNSNTNTAVDDNDENCTVTIPDSILSWKDTGGVLGTHMLAFRVTPLTQEECLQLQSSKKTRIRKRKIGSPVPNGKVTLNGYKSHVNVEEHEIEDITASVTNESNTVHTLCNNTEHNNDDPLQYQAPDANCHNTTAPKNNKLIISVPRRYSLEQTMSPSQLKSKRRTRVQLLIDGDKPKSQCPKWEKLPVLKDDVHDVLAKHTRSNTTANDDSVIFMNGNNSYKRRHSDSGVLESNCEFLEESVEGALRDPCNPPPSKKFHIDQQSEDHQLNDNPMIHHFKMYYAELVAFDSRQECLLVDGSYDLNLKECSVATFKESKNGSWLKSMPFDLNTILDKANDVVMPTGKDTNDVSLKFSIAWSSGPPKARAKEASATGLDVIKLRNEYEGIIHSLSSSDHESAAKLEQPPGPSPKATIFNFLYNKNTLQQTELKHNHVCPWCSLDCKQLYSQLKHMSLCHPRFLFTYSPVEGGATIDVRINKSYESGTLDPSQEENTLRRKKYPTKCKPFTTVLVETRTKEKDDLSEFMVHKQLSRTKNRTTRLFYHTHSCLPMISNDKDSDDEVDQWLKLTSSRMVDEFIDVNHGEKQFMKIWNLFIMEHKILADKQVSSICILFAKQKKKELLEKHIVYNFISHVIYICDIGLIPTATLTEVVKVLFST